MAVGARAQGAAPLQVRARAGFRVRVRVRVGVSEEHAHVASGAARRVLHGRPRGEPQPGARRGEVVRPKVARPAAADGELEELQRGDLALPPK